MSLMIYSVEHIANVDGDIMTTYKLFSTFEKAKERYDIVTKEVEKSFINEFGEGEFDYRTNGDRRCKFFADDNNWDTLSIDAKWVE